jgi:hypothetical protein
VRIADAERLREFRRTWTLHHKLAEEQIKHGRRVTQVAEAAMYHGGDVIYKLEGVPGIWHERLLEPA